MSKRYSPDEHAARRNNELDYLCGERIPATLSVDAARFAIVSAWVSDEGGGALAGMEDWTRLCADKDGEANMCCGKWTGDDDYNMPLDLRDTYQQRMVISMPDNLLE